MPTWTGQRLWECFSTHSFLPPQPQSPAPTANFQIDTMINDPGKNLISCPVVQGWFPIKELTQDNYFLPSASNPLFNCRHSSLPVWKQNQFLNCHLVTTSESQKAKAGRDLKGNVIRPSLFLQFKQDWRWRPLLTSSVCTWSATKGRGNYYQGRAQHGSSLISHYGVTFNETVYFKLGTNHHGRLVLQLWAQAKHKQNKCQWNPSETAMQLPHSVNFRTP